MQYRGVQGEMQLPLTHDPDLQMTEDTTPVSFHRSMHITNKTVYGHFEIPTKSRMV